MIFYAKIESPLYYLLKKDSVTELQITPISNYRMANNRMANEQTAKTTEQT
jgi:hypothetical protein